MGELPPLGDTGSDRLAEMVENSFVQKGFWPRVLSVAGA